MAMNRSKSKKKRARKPRKVSSAAATTVNFYHTLMASYDSTLSRLVPPSATVHSMRPTSLMDLPPELCVQIYEHALALTSPVRVQKPFGILQMPHLLSVSKIVRNEALPIYYQLNTFHIHLSMDEFPSAARWIAGRVADMGGKPLRNVNFIISCISWGTVPTIMPLLELIWSRSLVVDIEHRKDKNAVGQDAHEDGPFLIASKYPAGYLQAGIEAAAVHTGQIGTNGGSMMEVVDAAAFALGHMASLANDQKSGMGPRMYNLYKKLAAQRARYFKTGERHASPGCEFDELYRKQCRKWEKKSLQQQLERASSTPRDCSLGTDRERCAEIYQRLCRGSSMGYRMVDRLSTRA
ncbi:hypothetical protein DOTSEDRAFT_26459 [Dothistroma septosporum NZE10]|uniref:F-box domain-containing protein n=1 Tax=Dothistroma septosporum (strain NZE10 / CBS 128990) TaxID=675120 RepID=N1PIB5_DOTSN|nr:hypothetical protein DOTSEDRAFT_26459 [Dothistroma septosporum NZE10]